MALNTSDWPAHMAQIQSIVKRVRTRLSYAPVVISKARHPGRGYPHASRKSLLARVRDLAYLTLRHGSPCHSAYYAQGLDRVGSSARREFMPYREFRWLRNSANLQHPEASNYRYLLEDKIRFQAYFGFLGTPLANTVGVLYESLHLEPLDNKLTPLSSKPLEELADDKYFCKKPISRLGKGAFRLELKHGTFSVDDRDTTADELRKRLEGERYLIQTALRQHASVSRLHPTSVNTLRVITVIVSGEPVVFSLYLRIGIRGQCVDYSQQGTVLLALDSDGNAASEGFHFASDEVCPTADHPDTGVPFAGLQVPFVRECLEIAVAAHRHVAVVRSIGWDLAITETGPVVVEGNHDWGGESMMWVIPDFASRFRRSHAAHGYP